MNTSSQSNEKDSTLTEDEHRSWMLLTEHDGWENVAADKVYARAVEAVAWELIEQTMDTADREPSAETYREAMLTAHRLLGSLRITSPGCTCGSWDDGHPGDCPAVRHTSPAEERR